MDFQKMTSFFKVFRKYLSGAYNFFRDNKNNSKIMLLIALATSFLAIYFGIQLYTVLSSLNGKSAGLSNLSNFDIRSLEANPLTQVVVKNSDTLQDIIQENNLTQ